MADLFRIAARGVSLTFGFGYLVAFVITSRHLWDAAQEFNDHVCKRLPPSLQIGRMEPEPHLTKEEKIIIFQIKDELCETLQDFGLVPPNSYPPSHYIQNESKVDIPQLYFQLAKSYHLFILLLLVLIPQSFGAWSLFKATRFGTPPCIAIPLARRHQIIQQVIWIFELISVICTFSVHLNQGHSKEGIKQCVSWPLRDLLFRGIFYQLVFFFIVTKEDERDNVGRLDIEKGSLTKNSGIVHFKNPEQDFMIKRNGKQPE